MIGASIDNAVALVLAIATVVYLLVVIARPEKF